MDGVRFRLRLDRARAEDGFSLIESVVAIGIFGLVTILMASTLAGGLRGVHFSKQRAAATADANEILEQARSLKFENVGLASSDPTLAADPKIAGTCPSACTFDGEPVVFAASTSGHPFNPHIQTGIQRPPVTLARAIYVTGNDTDGDGLWDIRRVTVIVSWDRPAVGGAANSVTATTLISENSPGTIRNPPLGTIIPQEFPPLLGETIAAAGSIFVEAKAGGSSDLDSPSGPTPATLRITAVNGKGTNTLLANSDVSCSQQTQLLQGVESTSGRSANAVADSTTNQGPNSDTQSQSEPLAGRVALPLVLPAEVVTGLATCTASGVTNATELPHESGSSEVASLSTSILTTGLDLLDSLGSFAPAEMNVMEASQSVAQSNPSTKQMDATATHSIAGVTLLRQFGLGLGVVDLGVPQGLVRISAYEATATASGGETSGSSAVNADPSKPLTIRIWDDGVSGSLTDGQGNPVVCSSRDGKYCVITPDISESETINGTYERCVGLLGLCKLRVRIDVSVQINPATMQTLTLADNITKVYRAEYAPLSAMARLRVANVGESNKLDIRTTADAGRILACAKYGVHPGGCS